MIHACNITTPASIVDSSEAVGVIQEPWEMLVVSLKIYEVCLVQYASITNCAIPLWGMRDAQYIKVPD